MTTQSYVLYPEERHEWTERELAFFEMGKQLTERRFAPLIEAARAYRDAHEAMWNEYEAGGAKPVLGPLRIAYDAAQARLLEAARTLEGHVAVSADVDRVVRAYDKHFPPDSPAAPQSIADYDDEELDAIFKGLARALVGVDE